MVKITENMVKNTLVTMVCLLFLSFCVPVHFTDVEESKVTDVTYTYGKVTVTGTTYGDPSFNVYGMLLSSGDIQRKYNLHITCTEDVTIMTGKTRYRAADATTGSYFCSNDVGSLKIKEAGGWVTLAAKGVADKIVLYKYAPSTRDLEP